MKRTILFLAVLAMAGSATIHYAGRPATKIATPPEPEAAQTAADPSPLNAPEAKPRQPPQHPSQAESGVANRAGGTAAPSSVEGIAFTALIDTLVSPHATYVEKQAAWKHLQDAGGLADATRELEQRGAGDPNNALYPAALGQAHLKLCATSTDVRAQAIWAMTADGDFETALNLDPSNWDARYTKAVAMSYWPANLNRGDEVIQQFIILMGQQEQQVPQPQFAQTYEWLGKQYRKAGQADAARQVWQHGASLYPDNQTLQSLLAESATAQQ